MTTPIELVINGKDNTGSMFASATGGLQSIFNTAMGILTSQVFTKIASTVVDFTTSIVNEAREAQQVQAQTNAVLKSTGGIAGVTAEEVSKYADAISMASKFTDEQVASGENMLLTFTNIGKDVFPMATQTMADMSAALGQDLSASAMQLGKALNDPIQGVSALRRVGVQLTDEQENQVKAFMAAGDAASAQKLILNELGREFGGSAKAQATSWDILQHKFDNVKEKLGTALLPALDKLGDFLIKALDNPVVQSGIDALTNGITFLSNEFSHGLNVVDTFFRRLQMGKVGDENIKHLIVVIETLFRRFQAGNLTFDSFAKNIGKALAPFIPPALMNFLNVLGHWFEKYGPSIQANASKMFSAFGKAITDVGAKLGPFVGQTLQKLTSWIDKNGPAIAKFIDGQIQGFTAIIPYIASFADVLLSVVGTAIDLVLGMSTFFIQVFSGDLPGAFNTAVTNAQQLAENISTIFTKFVSWVMTFFGTNLKAVNKQWSDNFNQLKQIVSSVFTIIQSNISSKINEIKNSFTNGVQSWLGILSGYMSNFEDVGIKIINAIQSGISSGAVAFTSFLQGVIRDAINAALAALGLPPLSGGGGDGGNVPAYAEGTDYVPKTGVALLHRGERVVPASVNSRSNTYQSFYNFGTYNGAAQSGGNSSLDKFKR